MLKQSFNIQGKKYEINVIDNFNDSPIGALEVWANDEASLEEFLNSVDHRNEYEIHGYKLTAVYYVPKYKNKCMYFEK